MKANRAIRLRRLSEADLDLVLGWRNSESVRRYMFSRHVIDAEEHRNWYEGISKDPARSPLVFEVDGAPLAFVGLTIAAGNIATWGFYLSPEAPKGTGKAMGSKALEFAFGDLRVHKLCGAVLAFNEASIRFHRTLGFRQEGLMKDQFFDGREYQDILHFGLLANEWSGADPESKP